MPKPQSKTQKKIDHGIRLALANLCDQWLEELPGFQWLTHQADYANFPASLLITCVFDQEASFQQIQQDGADQALRQRIQQTLIKLGVVLKNREQQIIFDDEQSCAAEHDGNWARRLEARKGRAVPRNRPNNSSSGR